MNPLFDPWGIKSFLDGFTAQTRRRGAHQYAAGAVIDVACVQPNRLFAAVVRDTQEYLVGFEYDAKARSWSSECACPKMYECKHAYAAMLALQANAQELSQATTRARVNDGAKLKSKLKTDAAPAREQMQPPLSPLSTALTEASGRKLNRAETDYVQRI